MSKPNTSSEVDYRRIANRIRDAYTLNEAEQLLTEFMNQSEIKGRIDELEKALLNISCFNPEVVKNRIEYLNQMKGKDK